MRLVTSFATTATMSIASWRLLRARDATRRPSSAPIAGYGQPSRISVGGRRDLNALQSRSGRVRVDTQRLIKSQLAVVLQRSWRSRSLRLPSWLGPGCTTGSAASRRQHPSRRCAGMPPHEILTIVRSTGMKPVSRPIRRGPVYVLRALDRAGEEVRVIVDARRGPLSQSPR